MNKQELIEQIQKNHCYKFDVLNGYRKPALSINHINEIISLCAKHYREECKEVVGYMGIINMNDSPAEITQKMRKAIDEVFDEH